LDADDWISERDVEAVRAAARVMPVAIASGRIPEDVGHYARLLGLQTPQVCDNGARLLDPVRGRTLSHLAIEESHARVIVERIEQSGLRYFAVDSGRTVRSSAGFESWQVTVITCAVPDRVAAEAMAAERGSRDEWYVNYTHGDAHKGYGALQFSRSVGVPLDRIMAVGDGLNDREMFAVVGMPVAMAHAPEEIKSIAGSTTGSLEEHGVAQAIERFVFDAARV